MASALLVCGSRSLTRDPDRLAWVTDTLRAVLSPRPDLLVHGGARGPDEMADAEAARVQVPDILTFYTGPPLGGRCASWALWTPPARPGAPTTPCASRGPPG